MAKAMLVEAEGLVHVVNEANAEYTLCGDAFDLGSDIDGYEWTEARRKVVTCGPCARIVLSCRGIRVEQENAGG